MSVLNIPEGIEGDYIETKKDNLFFDVKGIHHPNERKICFLRFYPHPDGDRIKDGIFFKKVYDLSERFSILREKFPKYLYSSKDLDMELQTVRNEDIKKIYTPREYFNGLNEKANLTQIENCSKRLCDLFISKGDIPENSIGISGSLMVGLDKDDSDIDIIINGTERGLKFQKKLIKIFKESNKCRKYNSKEYESHYNWRFGGSDITFNDYIRSEQRKLHQGKFDGIDFFIRYIKSPNDWQGTYYDYKFKNCGRVKLKALILDSKDSIFTPCSYKINTSKILGKNFLLNEINFKDILEVNSFRARFCEHAKEGETVFVEGKLEKVNYKNELEYYRVLLTDQTKDKMIIVN